MHWPIFLIPHALRETIQQQNVYGEQEDRKKDPAHPWWPYVHKWSPLYIKISEMILFLEAMILYLPPEKPILLASKGGHCEHIALKFCMVPIYFSPSEDFLCYLRLLQG